MGIGDWGLGIGDWAQSPIPNHKLYPYNILLNNINIIILEYYKNNNYKIIIFTLDFFMEEAENELDFNQFRNDLNSLPSFYSISNGHLDYKNEKNKNIPLISNLEEIEDIKFILQEINKAIQITIDQNIDNDCEELVSILRKSTVKHQKSVVTRKISKKNMFKPLKKPKKIFVKVLKNDTPFIYTQNTNIDSKKTTASNTTLKCDNNEVNMTEKANY